VARRTAAALGVVAPTAVELLQYKFDLTEFKPNSNFDESEHFLVIVEDKSNTLVQK
jgi:hypothetical protein